MVSELYKHSLNQGQASPLYFWRDSSGHEVDLLVETPWGLRPIEIKSGSTFASDWLLGLTKWLKVSNEKKQVAQLVYGGDESYERSGVKVWSWRESWKAGTSLLHAD